MQKTVSLSSAEAEYYSASEMAAEIIYLRNPLSSIEWSNHVMGGCERAKHIDIRSLNNLLGKDPPTALERT